MNVKDESPARGLKNILSKKKQSSREDAISILDSNSPSRESTDSAIAKARSRNDSTDNGDLNDGRISKFIPGIGRRKEKRRRKSQLREGDSVEDFRDRDGAPKSSNSLGVSPSASTLNEEHSSLLTSDSDEDL